MDSLFQDEELEKGNHVPDKSEKPPSRVMAVLVPYPIDKAYDYGVPDHLQVDVGDYVCVPLGGREVTGVVWGAPAGDVNPKKIKYILDRYDAKPMRKVHRDFIAWAARYTASPLGSVLKMTVSVPQGLEAPKPMQGYKIADTVRQDKLGDMKLSPQRRSVMDVLGDGRYAKLQTLQGSQGAARPS